MPRKQNLVNDRGPVNVWFVHWFPDGGWVTKRRQCWISDNKINHAGKFYKRGTLFTPTTGGMVELITIENYNDWEKMP
jgi:hypothetical protein